ncbi:MAG: HlyD family efflux transporter periplasmic adaptor subunit [Anaerolineales bacterium]|jgi:multidrug resistance efflux pump|nr:HlyD family efflux transporter periplasmic adaptor subunit [Chloroflexota bacterium]MBK6645323.1 HlyD family efflux transporter periplasmic adaptor subunit [Anaerolineales bacterium]
MKKNMMFLISLVVLFTLALSACGGGDAAATPEPAVEETVSSGDVVAEGRLEPVHAANLSFQARGVVEEIFVKAGDAVSGGDILARLTNAGAAEAQVLVAQNAYDTLLRNESGDRAKLWDAYMQAQVARAEAEREWEDLDVDAIDDRIEEIEGDIEDLKEDLQDAQDEFDKYKDLDEENSKRKTAEDDLETAQEDLNDKARELEEEARKRDEVKSKYDAALAAEAEAKYQYEISLDGPNADQLAIARANLDAAKDALSAYVIVAPFSGMVADVNVGAGEQVTLDTRVVSLVDDSQWYVETTDVTELEVVDLSVGQPVVLRPDALPDLELTGTVEAISSAFTQSGGDILYTVRVRVNGSDPMLKWGMTVETIFTSAE